MFPCDPKFHANKLILSYDGDDTISKSVQQPQPSLPEPVEISTAIEISSASNGANNDSTIKEESGDNNHDQHAYGNGQTGTSWMDGQGNDGQGISSYIDTAVEEESRGIGIKEDG